MDQNALLEGRIRDLSEKACYEVTVVKGEI